MRALLSAGIVSLIMAYTLSQFYRAFLAVLSPVLQAELGAPVVSSPGASSQAALG